MLSEERGETEVYLLPRSACDPARRGGYPPIQRGLPGLSRGGVAGAVRACSRSELYRVPYAEAAYRRCHPCGDDRPQDRPSTAAGRSARREKGAARTVVVPGRGGGVLS